MQAKSLKGFGSLGSFQNFLSCSPSWEAFARKQKLRLKKLPPDSTLISLATSMSFFFESSARHICRCSPGKPWVVHWAKGINAESMHACICAEQKKQLSTTSLLTNERQQAASPGASWQRQPELHSLLNQFSLKSKYQSFVNGSSVVSVSVASCCHVYDYCIMMYYAHHVKIPRLGLKAMTWPKPQA